MKSYFVLPALIVLTSAVCFGAPPAAVTVCPQAKLLTTPTDNTQYENNVAAQGTCNQSFVFTNGSVAVIMGNTVPYDGDEDTLIGVVNNSTVTITSFQVSNPGASPAIFALDNDGICFYAPFPTNSQPCNATAPGAENYAGSASSYTLIAADSNSGTINFSPGIPPGGTGYFSLEGPASPTTVVVASPILTKGFAPTSVLMNGTSILSFTVNNPNAVPIAGVAFSDTLPAGVSINTPSGLSGTCGAGATITATAGTQTVSLSGGSILANSTCTFSVAVIGTVGGPHLNTTSTITATANGVATPVGPVATATLTVIPLNPPTISKAFSPTKIIPGGTTTLTFTVTNPNSAGPVSAVGFTDTLPGSLTVASPINLSSTCPGTLTATAGSTSISLAGATLAASATCTIHVTVTGTATGPLLTNTTSTITSNVGSGTPATATLSIAAEPVLTKSFGTVSLLPNGSTTLTLVLSNPNTNVMLSGLTFTDPLPAGLTVSTPNGLTETCNGSTLAVAGSSSISLSGATLAPGTSCTITLFVTGSSTISGLQTNVTSTVTSNEAPGGLPATAVINVGDPYQVSYIPNLNHGDSYVNITNTGQSGAGLASGTSASVTGAICANVYVFDPSEEIVSCCSCPVTPNGLVSLSAINDLVSNGLTRANPTSVVIKLLGTAPVGGSCNNSALLGGTPVLASGLAAWSTKLHANTSASPGEGGAGGAYSLTETPVTSSDLSAGELARLAYSCGVVANVGSGFGVCSSCRLGALGADKVQ